MACTSEVISGVEYAVSHDVYCPFKKIMAKSMNDINIKLCKGNLFGILRSCMGYVILNAKHKSGYGQLFFVIY